VKTKVEELIASSGITAGVIGTTVTATSQVQVTVDGDCPTLIPALESVIDQLVASVNAYTGQAYAPQQLPMCQYTMVPAPSQPPSPSTPPPSPIMPPPLTPLPNDSKDSLWTPLAISMGVVFFGMVLCVGLYFLNRRSRRVVKIEPVLRGTTQADSGRSQWVRPSMNLFGSDSAPHRSQSPATEGEEVSAEVAREVDTQVAHNHVEDFAAAISEGEEVEEMHVDEHDDDMALQDTSQLDGELVVGEQLNAGSEGASASRNTPNPQAPQSGDAGGGLALPPAPNASLPASPPQQTVRVEATNLVVDAFEMQAARHHRALETAAQQDVEAPDDISDLEDDT